MGLKFFLFFSNVCFFSSNTEVKKTRTAPLFNQTALDIPVSPPPVESRHDFMKSLTTSMTLDRRAVSPILRPTDQEV